MTTTECLRQVRAKKISLDGKLEHLERLKAIAEGTTPQYNTVAKIKKTASDKVGSSAAKIVDYYTTIETEAAEIVDYLTGVQNAINCIDNEEHRTAFELYYINGFTWEEVALKFGMSRQSMWQWNKAGVEEIKRNGAEYLKKLQELLEQKAVKKNGGECQSYPYCRFCEEPEKFFRKSETPCADAKARWETSKK